MKRLSPIALALVFMTGAPYAHSETFFLQNGEKVFGDVVRSLAGTVTIKLDDRGMRQVPLKDIARIELKTESGAPISGALQRWSRGAYQVLVSGQLIEVRDGRIVGAAWQLRSSEFITGTESVANTTTSEQPVAAATDDNIVVEVAPRVDSNTSNTVIIEDQEKVVETLREETVTPVLAAIEPVSVVTPASVTQSLEVGSELEAVTRDPVQSEATQSEPPDAPPLVLVGSAEPTREDSGEIVFHFGLSQPTEESIIVVFSTADRTAAKGADYKQTFGTVKFEAGSDSATVSIPLIDDNAAETQEEFGLFLSTYRNIVLPESRWVVATIEDDD